MPSEPTTTVAAPKIPLFEPDLTGNEWRYVKECLDTGWVSSVGSYVDRFEQAVAARIGCRHAVATTSGTAALHVALLVAGVQPEDEVLVPALTFVAPANAVRYVGAHPVFVDAEAQFWQMDPALVDRFLEDDCVRTDGVCRNRRTGRRVRAIVVVHLLGHPVDLDHLVEAARRRGLAVIEDVCESLGAAYKDRPVGRVGDLACFSFNGSKIVTSGGGGMIVTDDGAAARRARYLTTQAKDDPIEYVHNEVGYNYRLTNVQAAIGLAQFERLDAFVARKREIASTYASGLSACPALRLHPAAEWASSTYWLYTVLTSGEPGSRPLLRRLARAGIEARPLWTPMFALAAFRECERIGGAVAERLHREGLSLPSSTTLKPEQQQRVIETMLVECGAAARG